MGKSHTHGCEVALDLGRLTLEGKSVAGNETYFRIRELGIALDVGRCPDFLVGVSHVFVTHPHLDHSLGIPYYAAQRRLQKLAPGNVYVPAETLDAYRELIVLHERLQSTSYEIRLVGVKVGETISLRKDLRVRGAVATHSVPARAWEVLDVRHKLKPELAGLDEAEIRDRALRGEAVAEENEELLLFYSGDTDREIFTASPELFDARILVLECTFTTDEDRERADRYRHIHLDDVVDAAERFRNETIVLTHFSLRDSPDEVHRNVASRLPSNLRDRVRLALPRPYDRVDANRS